MLGERDRRIGIGRGAVSADRSPQGWVDGERVAADHDAQAGAARIGADRLDQIPHRMQVIAQLQRARAQNLLAVGTDLQAAAVLFLGAVQGLVIQSALAGDEAMMMKRARKLFPLLLHGYRGRRKP